MQVNLAYGKTGLVANLPDKNVTVIEPRFVPGLPDERASLEVAMRSPIGTPPLREIVREDDSVAIVFSDLTRPMPSDRVLPPLLDEISHVPVGQIVLINGTGTHRPSTRDELISILGEDIVERYRIVQHECTEESEMVDVGMTSFGHRTLLNRTYMEASVKILTGFIEPHIFAGFSGGPKAVLPGIASLDSILDNHGAKMVGHANATWGITEGNPLWEEMREVALRTNPSFLLNVSLNKERQITGVFAGELQAAHQVGVEFVKESAMVGVDAPFDIVITTNSGYPLDLNLYQSAKGMSAAAQIVKQGGSIIAAVECWEGVPDHGDYKRLLKMAKTPQDLLDMVHRPGFRCRDQWEIHVQGLYQQKATVYVKNSYLTDEEVREALYIPCDTVEEALDESLRRYGPDASIAVLPDGPQTIPYLQG